MLPFAFLVSTYINWHPRQSNENSRKTVRLTAEPAYASSLDAMQLALDAAERGEGVEMQKQLARIRVNLLRLEPLIEKPREPLWDDYKKFGEFCSEILLASGQVSAQDQAEARKKKVDSPYSTMHDRLYHFLVDKGPK